MIARQDEVCGALAHEKIPSNVVILRDDEGWLLEIHTPRPVSQWENAAVNNVLAQLNVRGAIIVLPPETTPPPPGLRIVPPGVKTPSRT